MTLSITYAKLQRVKHWKHQDFVDTLLNSGLWKCSGYKPGEYELFYHLKDQKRALRVWYPIADGTFSVWRFGE